jgi:hypothetical protein
VPDSDDFIMGEYGNGPDRAPVVDYVKGIKLRRVLPVARSHVIQGHEITIASLELYEDGIIVRYHFVASEARRLEIEARANEESRLISEGKISELAKRLLGDRKASGGGDHGMPSLPWDDILLRLADDLGTPYHGRWRGGGGGEEHWEASYGFTPAVPANARQLRLSIESADRDPVAGERGLPAVFRPPPAKSLILHVIEIDL